MPQKPAMDEKKHNENDFSSLLDGVKPLKPKNYVNLAERKKQSSSVKLSQSKQRLQQSIKEYAQQQASIELSDEFEAHWPQNKPIQYIRANMSDTPDAKYEVKDVLKRLKMGLIPPDIELDLHGCTAKQAKEEIIAVIFEAKKRHDRCVNIIHGHGNGTLKQKTPNYLVQHPDVTAFVQSPKAYGGKAGLLVLVTDDLSQVKN